VIIVFACEDDGDGWLKVAKIKAEVVKVKKKRENTTSEGLVKLSECGKTTPLDKTASVVPLLADDRRLCGCWK